VKKSLFLAGTGEHDLKLAKHQKKHAAIQTCNKLHQLLEKQTCKRIIFDSFV
jgi:hypothetical protein